MTRHSGGRLEPFRPVVALGRAYLRIRVRDARLLFFNPIALVASTLAIGTYVWLLVSQAEVFTRNTASIQPHVAAFIFGLFLALVVITSQLGSPLRLKPGDVSWALPSEHGPQTVLLIHAFGTPVAGFFGGTMASIVALTVRDVPAQLSLLSGLAVMSLLLLVRALSLVAHLLGSFISKRVRALFLGILAIVTASWVLAFVAFLTWESTRWSPLGRIAEASAQPFRAIVDPEAGGLATSTVYIAISLALMSFVLASSHRFVGPAVRESLEANQLSRALSGGRPSATQGRGYSVGYKSWSRWPVSPMGALIVSYLARARRRYLQYVAMGAVLFGLVLASVLTGGLLPLEVTIVIAILIPALSSPTQYFAAELEHQHLILADTPFARLGLAGTSLNALFNLIVSAPAAVLGVSVAFDNAWWGVFFLVPLAVFCLCASVAGLASWGFSEAPGGRALASLIISALPLLAAISSVSMYGEAWLPLRTWVTTTGTLAFATVLYSGLALAVIPSVGQASWPPASSEAAVKLVDPSKSS